MLYYKSVCMCRLHCSAMSSIYIREPGQEQVKDTFVYYWKRDVCLRQDFQYYKHLHKLSTLWCFIHVSHYAACFPFICSITIELVTVEISFQFNFMERLGTEISCILFFFFFIYFIFLSIHCARSSFDCLAVRVTLYCWSW